MLLKWEQGLYGIRPVVDFNIMQPDEALTPAQRAVKNIHLDYNRRAFRIPLKGVITVKGLDKTLKEFYREPQWSNEWRTGK